MKNKIYIVGIISTVVFCLGCFFKIMHWPLAGVLMVLGITFISLIFMPLSLLSSYKQETNKNLKVLYISTGIVLTFDFIASMFKVMHWPGAGFLLLISLPLVFVILLPIYLYYNRKEEKINYKNFMPVIFFFAYFAAISALLTLSVSKNILKDFTESAKTFEVKTNILHEECQELYKLTINDTSVTKEFSKFLMDVKKQSEAVESKIENYKRVLIIENSGNPEEVILNGTLKIEQIKIRDIRVREETFYEQDISNELLKLKNLILANSRLNNESRAVIDLLINESNLDQWKFDIFRGKILISLIDVLDRMKYQVNLAEYVVLQK